ncbi:protein-tyrosine-phosphatase [bacterium]|nr:protein-tyrosine-phosphatase [bacterium]
MFPELIDNIAKLRQTPIPEHRKSLLAPLSTWLSLKSERSETANLNFICTHNSRRSQLAQVWAQTVAHYFHLDIRCFSGGTEVTALHPKIAETLKQAGFKIEVAGNSNPVYSIYYSNDVAPIPIYSKLFDQQPTDYKPFASIMTCTTADQNCPYVAGSEKRIALPYNDPGQYDHTLKQSAAYKACSEQIASELIYAFAQVIQKKS